MIGSTHALGVAGGAGRRRGEGTVLPVLFSPLDFFVAALAEAFDGGGEDALSFFRLGIVSEGEGVLVRGAAVASLPAHVYCGGEGVVGEDTGRQLGVR